MLVSPDVLAVVTAAGALVDAIDNDPSLPRARGGASAGPALQRAGDFFGPTVTVASRIGDVAQAGSLVATQSVLDAAAGSRRWRPYGHIS
jgi:adenylate cyclase